MIGTKDNDPERVMRRKKSDGKRGSKKARMEEAEDSIEMEEEVEEEEILEDDAVEEEKKMEGEEENDVT